MTMRSIQGVSFPRSGHEVVYNVARLYFEDSLTYCDPLQSRHCGCGNVPCMNPDRTFAKHHDFDLATSPGTPIIPSERYLVQYRNPVRSIVSNYYLFVRNNPEKDTRSDWEKFAFKSIFHWNRFIDKWVLDFPFDSVTVLYCSYESLLASPADRVTEILHFMSGDPLDHDKIDGVLNKITISPRNNLAEFRFFDTELFREMEEAARERLGELHAPSFDEGV